MADTAKEREDNIVQPAAGSLDELNVDVGDIDIEEESSEKEDEVEDEPSEEEEEETPPSPKKKTPVKDFYNHRRRSKFTKEEEELRAKYADLEVDDDPALDQYKVNRRALADRLEKDPVFREKYIQAEKARRQHKKEKEELEEVLRSLQNKKEQKELEEGEELPLPEDDGSVTPSAGRNCVYIQKVKNLTINFKF